MRFLLNIGIQSVSDVITNSSSELYLVSVSDRSEDVRKIQKYIEKTCNSFFKTNDYDYEKAEKIAKKKLGFKDVPMSELTKDQRAHVWHEMNLYRIDNMCESCSGMGGDLDFISLKRKYDLYVVEVNNRNKKPRALQEQVMSFKEWLRYEWGINDEMVSDKDLENPESLFIVDIDHNRLSSINFLKTEFNAKYI